MKNRKKPIILAMAIALSLVTMASATYAWFTAKDSVTNHLATDQLTNGDVKIVEVFDPEDPLNPGVDVNKDVGAVNTGSTDALVRMSFAEVLQKLSNSGNATSANAVWNGGTANIPQLFDSKAIAAGGAYTAANGWSDITKAPAGTFELNSLSIPSGVTVLYKATVIGGKTTYQFVAYGTISAAGSKFDGLLQNVSADFQYNKTTKEVTVANNAWDFWQFTAGSDVKAKWAELASFADIDSSFGAAKLPAATLPRAQAQSDSNIELLFTGAVKSDISLCDEGDWWYNKDDGYFYYIGKLASGQATKNNLLDAVGLNAAADSSYCNLSYDLIVKMEGIQNVKEAVKSTVGWAMPDNATTDALIARLTALSVFA
jgi:hypothetical protein